MWAKCACCVEDGTSSTSTLHPSESSVDLVGTNVSANPTNHEEISVANVTPGLASGTQTGPVHSSGEPTPTKVA
eukprot:5996336-Amphidinium_carterae.1